MQPINAVIRTVCAVIVGVILAGCSAASSASPVVTADSRPAVAAQPAATAPTQEATPEPSASPSKTCKPPTGTAHRLVWWAKMAGKAQYTQGFDKAILLRDPTQPGADIRHPRVVNDSAAMSSVTWLVNAALADQATVVVYYRDEAGNCAVTPRGILSGNIVAVTVPVPLEQIVAAVLTVKPLARRAG